MVVFASQGVPRAVAGALFLTLLIGYLVYLAINLRQGRKEIGSEIELAANRKAYYPDEELEGRRLERSQIIGLGFLLICAVGLPIYWLYEPSRQAGAVKAWDEEFARWGKADFAATAKGGFNCAGCHGGEKAAGGVAEYTVTDPVTGVAKQVQWKAPALNTVLLRYREDEVRTILVYGRPFSPMSAWGIAGGGPMNDQQINNIIHYLRSIQLCDPASATVCQAAQDEVTKNLADAMATGKYKTEGEALFNLEAGSGAYSCARCHTKGWSYGDPQVSGGGAYGPSLVGGVTASHFPDPIDQVTFVNQPPGVGKKYGSQNQQFKPMPAFGKMLTQQQIRAIVDYERGL